MRKHFHRICKSNKRIYADSVKIFEFFCFNTLSNFGIYDKIGAFGGAGSIIPITGFANSIVSPAIEHKREGIVFGLCANMFSIAGPVIVFGISASIIVGLIYLFI